MIRPLFLLLLLLSSTAFAAVERPARKGPGSGSGNNNNLADFYNYGQLAFAFLRERAELTRPDYKKLPMQPLLDKWQEFRDEKIKVVAVFDEPLYDAQGRRVNVKTDSAHHVTYIDGTWAEYGQGRPLIGYIFRAVLGQLAAENPEYEDVDRGISNILANIVLDRLTLAGYELPYHVVNAKSVGYTNPKGNALYTALKAAGLRARKQGNEGVASVTLQIKLQNLRCAFDGADRYDCGSWKVDSYWIPALDVQGAPAKRIYEALRALQPELLSRVGENESQQGSEFLVHDLLCTKYGTHEAECVLQQVPRAGAEMVALSRFATYDPRGEEKVSVLDRVRAIGHAAMLELERGGLVNEDGQPLDVAPLVAKWREIESGAIRLELSTGSLYDAEGAPADVVTYPERKLTVLDPKRWDTYYVASEQMLRMVYHELCRHLEGEQPQLRDLGYRLSQALLRQTYAVVSNRLARTQGNLVEDKGVKAAHFFGLLTQAGARPVRQGNAEVIRLVDFQCDNTHEKPEEGFPGNYHIDCTSSGRRPIGANGRLADKLYYAMDDLALASEGGEDVDSIVVNELECTRALPSGATSCRLLQFHSLFSF